MESESWLSSFGTNDEVKIQMLGTTHTSDWIKLDNDKNNFEQGDLDRFKVVHLDLGNFESVKIKSK